MTCGEADRPGAPLPLLLGPLGAWGAGLPRSLQPPPMKCFLPQTQRSAHRGLCGISECPLPPVLLGFFLHEGGRIKRPIYAGLGFLHGAHLHRGLLDGWCFRQPGHSLEPQGVDVGYTTHLDLAGLDVAFSQEHVRLTGCSARTPHSSPPCSGPLGDAYNWFWEGQHQAGHGDFPDGFHQPPPAL